MTKNILLIHGLSAPSWLLNPMARFFRQKKFNVVSIHYPSRQQNLEHICQSIWNKIEPLIQDKTWHIVTHSLGGIAIQQILNDFKPKNIESIIMISPPNRGSELYSFFKQFFPPMLYVIGGANLPLGATKTPLAPNICKEYRCHLIAGRTSWTLSGCLIPRPNDGILSIDSMKINGLVSTQIIDREHLLMVFSKKTYHAILKIINGEI